MTHTKESLQALNKKDVYSVAKAIATELEAKNLPTQGLSKKNKQQLIQFVLEAQIMLAAAEENQKVTKELALEEISLPTVEEFFDSTIQLDDRNDIEEECNLLVEKIENKHTPATCSKQLSKYRKPFYSFEHNDPKLNDTVQTKEGVHTQFCAAKFLELSPEVKKQLIEQREKNELARKGFNDNGAIKNVELPQTDILEVIKKAAKLLNSSKPEEITCGILPLIGVRRNEQQLPSINYIENGKNLVVAREFKVVGEYLIAIRGLSKKHGDVSWFVRPTLVRAEVVYQAQQRYLSFEKVHQFKGDYQAYDNSGLRKATDRKFKEIWSEEFATIEAYNDKGVKVKENASTHKARAFYAWALVPILKANGYKNKQAKLYVQNCLGHDDSKDTEKYFDRYDEDQFVNGVDLDIPLKTEEVGVVSEERLNELLEDWEEERRLQKEEKAEELGEDKEAEEIVEDKEAEETVEDKEEQVDNLAANFKNEDADKKQDKLPVDCVNLTELADRIPAGLQAQLSQYLAESLNPTEAVANLINVLNLQKISISSPRKIDGVEAALKEIFAGILAYNAEQPEVKNCVYPTYSLVNKINRKMLDKELGKSVFDRVFGELKNDILERLAARGIGEKQNNFHRKCLNNTIDKIIRYINLNCENGA